jgi:general stress protein CsbA
MMDFVLALVIPFVTMIVVTRVTFSIVGACIVTWMIILFVLQVHQQSWGVWVLAIISFILGFNLAKKRLKRKPGM